jgi:predicted RNA-binding Zn-ribbon protein involved in translation (DUF1610 family)
LSTSQAKAQDEKYCSECGNIIKTKAEICPKCGVRQAPAPLPTHVGSGNPNIRKCIACGHHGEMKTWLRNSNVAQLIAVVGVLLWVVPGVAFIAWAWGKYKCPKCGELGKNAPA